MAEENLMRRILVEKVTVNMGFGNNPEELKRGQQIIERITQRNALKTRCKVKQPKWDIRPGLAIGLKVTMRNSAAKEFLQRALKAKDNQLKKKNFDYNGNFGFGIKEYIDMPGTKYDPTLGIRGFDVLVTLKRPGYRIKSRKIRNSKVGKKHVISKQEAMDYMAKEFEVEVV